jgi:hypothetical protein
MTTRRTKYDRRKRLPAIAIALEPSQPAEPSRADYVPLHRDPTAPWRLPRPWSGQVIYRLRVADVDRRREEDEHFAWQWAAMMVEASNDNKRLTPKDE